MASTLLIRNLPDTITEEALREALGQYIPINKIELMPDPAPATSDKQAVVHAEFSTFEAEKFAQRFNGRMVEGRKVAVSAMLFMG
ncbi:MAG: RNA-binding protein [Gammaproteobacteria bacterium]